MNKYNESLQSIGCYIARNTPYGYECKGQIVGHHKIGNQTCKGIAKKADDSERCGICWNHHTGKYGIHQMGVNTWEDKYATQDIMIKWTKQQMEEL